MNEIEAGSLLWAVDNVDKDMVRSLLALGADVDERCDTGASVLFRALLAADLELVRLLLDAGADPNFVADDEAEIFYAPKPLDFVMQLQHLLDWDKHTPFFDLLIERGATDSDGHVPTQEEEAVRKAGSIELQKNRQLD